MKLLLTLLITISVHASFGKTIRATELNSQNIQEIMTLRNGESIVSFKQGDEIDLELAIVGDLIESKNSTANIMTIKKDFDVKVASSNILISINGSKFKRLKELIKGELNLGASSNSSGQTPSFIQTMLSLYLK